MDLDFVYNTLGLDVSFRVITKTPPKSIFEWDFGDDNGYAYNKKLPTHTYEKPGFYQVTLTVTDSSGFNSTVSKTVIVTTKSKTHLTDSIYVLIDNYIPSVIGDGLTMEDKAMYINKWQLYIGPLVNHDTPIEDYNDELSYEGLENQLIMELAAWDFLNVRVMNILIQANGYIGEITSSTDNPDSDQADSARGDRIKSITTGPTEVQYYDKLTESGSSLFKAFTDALKPGGIIDELRKNLCTLANRLDIFLPFCENYRPIIPPRNVRLKRPGPLDVPNPRILINKHRR